MAAAACLLLIWLVPVSRSSAAEPSASDRPPNIVVILADDLGYGDVGCYNPDSKAATTNLDRLAAQGVRFTHAYSPAAWCTPTRYGLMTGRYPFRADLSWNRKSVIDEGRMTLASLVAQRGYATACVGKWHLGFDTGMDFSGDKRLAGGPVDRGFQSYFGLHASLDIPPYLFIQDDRPLVAPTETIEENVEPGYTIKYQGRFWRGGKIAPGFKHDDVLDRLTDEVIAWLKRHHERSPQQPFLLYYPMTAPHGPWVPGESFAGKSRCGKYGDFLIHTDHAVGRVLQALDELGYGGSDTLLIFTSDNGPLWFQADAERFGHRASYVFRGQKGDIWEGGVRMPLLARWPGKIPAGTTSDQVVSLTDVTATVASILNIPLPENAAEDSFDISPALFGRELPQPIREAVIVQSTSNDMLAIRSGDWKLIPWLGSGGFLVPPKTREPKPGEPVGQLYNLAEDPSEQNNVYAEHPEIVERLSGLLQRTRQQGRSR